MKLRVDKDALTEKLSVLQGVSERRATMPVLSHVLLSPEKGKLKMIATDLETTLIVNCDADIEGTGSVAVPSRKFFDIVKELPRGEIEMEEVKNSWIEIKTPTALFKIAGLPEEDFPTVPEVSIDNLFGIDSQVLDDMIFKTIYCTSGDELRRNLSGIYFEKIDSYTLRLVATDGHRLSYIDRKLDSEISLEKGILVPKKAVAELRKLIKQGSGMSIGCEKNFFVALTDDTVMFSRLIDADFPDYKQVVPSSFKSEFNVKKEDFLSAIKRVSIFSSEKTRNVKISLVPGSITLTSVSPDVGEARETLSVDFEGEGLDIGFNAKYLQDVLETVEQDEVSVRVTDELSPAVITPSGRDDYVCVVMPMRI